MKLPLSWLKEYVDIDISPEELADKLTRSGTEVESIETIGSSLDGVVVAQVKEFEKHPNADRLRLCKVDDGNEELQIVCGASNFEAGDKVVLAKVGTVLGEGFTIKEAKIRGEKSSGMLCSEQELGLTEDECMGIMILDTDLEAGTPIVDIVGEPEIVFEMEVTWNRPDCLSIIGLAREVAALCDLPLKMPEINLNENPAQNVKDFVKVSIADSEDCPRYAARIIENVKIKPSPIWMQRRLTACGVRAINNVVDITNYVLLELGQPLHAFDYTLLKDAEINVRRAKQDENIITLDDVERKLVDDMIVIADSSDPVALAGVMGGAGSEISGDTAKVLLESATFSPASIRSTSSRLALTSESAHRFERTVDAYGCDFASRRAAALMQELADGTVMSSVVDVFPAPKATHSIYLAYADIDKLMGFEICRKQISEILESLTINIVETSEDGLQLEIPSYRPDLVIEADIIEEIARMHGLEDIPEAPLKCSVVENADESSYRRTLALRRTLESLGISETMNYSFTSAKLLDVFSPEEGRLVLPNPVSLDYEVMRDSLIPQMVESLGRNQARQVEEASFYEIGATFKKDGDEPKEFRSCCIGLMGPIGRDSLDKRSKISDQESFSWLKGLLDKLSDSMRVANFTLEPKEICYFEKNRGFELLINGKVCGICGLVKNKIKNKWRIKDPVAIAEFDTAVLFAEKQNAIALKPVAQYPSTSRDLAVVVDETISYQKIEEEILKLKIRELVDISLFDIFRGKEVGENKKSLAYCLKFQSANKTLTDVQVNKFQKRIIDTLKNNVNAEIRDS
ncbi:MAG: phenylalanine--tRNA ligase subunit beta [Kiritimatiellae bacterium]|jgi:phenylalanyl-tRNA synthetase beta chain|nr:phenylalanine--tRNA ligase subunit beta [Kiritimatiellia bacterium]